MLIRMIVLCSLIISSYEELYLIDKIKDIDMLNQTNKCFREVNDLNEYKYSCGRYTYLKCNIYRLGKGYFSTINFKNNDYININTCNITTNFIFENYDFRLFWLIIVGPILLFTLVSFIFQNI